MHTLCTKLPHAFHLPLGTHHHLSKLDAVAELVTVQASHAECRELESWPS